MDKESVWSSVIEIENYLQRTGASLELLNSFNILKQTICNPENVFFNTLPVFSDLTTNLNEQNNANADDATNDYNLRNYSSLRSFRSISNTNTTDKKGWIIGKSRRNLRFDESNFQFYLNQLGKNWHLDLLELSNMPTLMEMGPIVSFGQVLLKDVGDKIHPDFNKLLLPVLKNIQDVYLPNPYHNALHGATVGHMSLLLSTAVTSKRRLKPHEEFGFIIASLGHDAGHPGKTNSFLSSTGNPLSLIYNDNSILENYHCSLIFHIMRFHSAFFNLIPNSEWEWLRKRIIQLVLSTDMKTHFTHIDNVKNKKDKNDFDIVENDDDYWLVLVLCIKAADIGHNFLPWADHLPWTFVLFEEFYIQGDEERLLSMPLLLFFDRTKSEDIPASQLGFFSAFTEPLLNELNYFDNSGFISSVLLKNSKDNLNYWRKNKGKSIKQILNELDNSNVQYNIEDAFI